MFHDNKSHTHPTLTLLVVRASPVRLCHKIGRDKGIQLCIEYRPYNHVLSTIGTEENWMDPNKEAILSSPFGKTLPRSLSLEREKDHRKDFSSEDPEVISIRTPLLTRICINSGLNIVTNRNE